MFLSSTIPETCWQRKTAPLYTRRR